MSLKQQILAALKDSKNPHENVKEIVRGLLSGQNYNSVLHPLLHENTSDLTTQKYTSTFSGQEFFLADHLVNGEKVLPGVSYLEMARVAVEKSSGKSGVLFSLSLKNVVWSRPIVVSEIDTKVHISIFSDESERFHFEVFTESNEKQFIHAKGMALYIEHASIDSASLELELIKESMDQGVLPPRVCYRTFESMGLSYGPSQQAIENIFLGENQLLAKLSLPESVQQTSNRYLLHPSLLDAALQSSIGLVVTPEMLVGNVDIELPLKIPFAVESVDILRPCSQSMYAFVRYSNGCSPEDSVQNLDIDLCDDQGRICVKMHKFSSRILDKGFNTSSSVLFAGPSWEPRPLAFSNVRSDEEVSAEFSNHLVVMSQVDSTEEIDTYADVIQSKISGSRCVCLTSELQGVSERFTDYAVRSFELVQALLEGKTKEKRFIQFVVPAAGEDASLSALSGLLRTAMLENPRVKAQLIQIEKHETKESIALKLQENSRSTNDLIVKYENDIRQVLVWNDLGGFSKSTQQSGLSFEDGGVYLITGGLGGLGLVFAREILNKTQNSKIILTGRSTLSVQRKHVIDTLNGQGGVVEYQAIDISDAEKVQSLIESVIGQYHTLNGVIHCAGVNVDNLILAKSTDEFCSVLSPKVTGVVNLDLATKNLPLDFFVLFSSVTGVLGNAGQSDYAVANAFMDQFAHYRTQQVETNRRSGKTLSINWPLWKEGGMTVDAESESMMKATTGMVAMTTEVGINAFYSALNSTYSQSIVMEGVLPKLKTLLFAQKTPEVKVISPKTSSSTNSQDDQSLLIKINALLVAMVSDILSIDPELIDLNTDLNDYGFESVTLTGFVNKLNDQYDLMLAPTIFFEYSDLNSFATFLVQEHRALFSEQSEIISELTESIKPDVQREQTQSSLKNNHFEANDIASLSSKQRSRFLTPKTEAKASFLSKETIAIIGMSGCFPGADNIEQFWDNLINEKQSITEIPSDRWDWNALYGTQDQEGNKTDIKWGGFIDSVAQFDPLFFGISPREAELMDPQQRLLMTHGYLAIEDAGYSAKSLSGKNVGVFVGTANSGYSSLISQSGVALDGYSSTGILPSVGPNRLSYFLNIHGPSEPIETACSSSLVAIHRAVEAINNGSCDSVIVGGVNTIVTPEGHISFNKAGMLSKDGQCKTFSSSANGYVRGEGVGILFVKKLSQAELDGDHIYGLIKGSAENHGGKSNSLTAPNPKAQAQLLKTAYTNAGVNPKSVSYIEAHGTGTKLGDPIEINGLKAAFKGLYEQSGLESPEKPHCGIGSVKTNIGHLELAAGIAGVIKVLLQFKHQKLVKTLHCEKINPYIDLDNSPFYILQETKDWNHLKDESGKNIQRIAGVSSFGFGGANAHVILEEYTSSDLNSVKPDSKSVSAESSVMIPLSARSPAQLKQQARQLLEYICATPSSEETFEQNVSHTQNHDARVSDHNERLDNVYFNIELKAIIIEKLSSLLDIDKSYIDNDNNFSDYGLELVHRNELFETICEKYDLDLLLSEFLEYESVNTLLAYCVENIHFSLTENSTIDAKVSSVVEAKVNNLVSCEPCASLESISYTLQVGRDDMEERVGLIVNSIQELKLKLEAYLSGDTGIENLYQGTVKNNKNTLEVFAMDEELQEAVEKWKARKKYTRLLDLWVKGLSIDWAELYGDVKPIRASLPGYPFATDRYWCTDVTESKQLSAMQNKKTIFLKKDWLASPLDIVSNNFRKAIIIYSAETELLAQEINDHCKAAVLVRSSEPLTETIFKQFSSIDTWIDLTGMAQSDADRYPLINLLQRFVEEKRQVGASLFFVTQGLEAYKSTSSDLSGADRVGLYRMLQSEYPAIKSRHLDLEINDSVATKSVLILNEVSAQPNSVEVCYRSTKRYISTVKVVDLNVSKFNFKGSKPVLITGGTRGLGLLCARHLVSHYGVRNLILTGKEALPPKSEWNTPSKFSTTIQTKIANIQSLQASGVDVEVRVLPLDNQAELKQAYQQVKNTMGGLSGIIHAAGISDADNPAFIRKTESGFRNVLTPKIDGTKNLLSAVDTEDLQFIILFSSVSAVMPTLAAGLSDYSTANAFLDYYAESYQNTLPIVSVQWPSWKDSGMGEVTGSAYLDQGLFSVTDTEGLALFDQILSNLDLSVVMPLIVNSDKFNAATSLQAPSHISSPRSNISGRAVNMVNASNSNVSKLLTDPLENWLCSLFSKQLKIEESVFDVENSFVNYGVDSILLTQILRQMNKALALDVDPSILLEYTSVRSLATWLCSSHLQAISNKFAAEASIEQTTVKQAISQENDQVQVSASTPTNDRDSNARIEQVHQNYTGPNNTESVAIVGMSCRLPGASSLGEYWKLLSEGRSAIKPVPFDCWGLETDYYAGLVDDVYGFDPSFFMLHPSDVQAMDPQALILLEESLKAIYHAGYTHQELAGNNTGVYIGARSRSLTNGVDLDNTRNPIMAVGQNYLAANLSQFFDFKGPSLVIDTACSSALVSMNMAVDALRSGSLETALVGGVSLLTNPESHEIFSQRNLLQESGEFHILDQRASGVVLGEGCGMVYLKTLSKAKQDGDCIYAVIAGMSINNDGRTAGPATPNIAAQKEVMQSALMQSGCTETELSYLDVNGSGSEVTDLLEIKAIDSVYCSSRENPLYLGSMKPNIGHPLCAEGIASFIKVALMLHHQSLVPFLSAKESLEHFSTEDAGFEFPRKAQAKPMQFAALNCFADGGTNAHVILQDANSENVVDCRNPLPLPSMNRVDARTLEPIETLKVVTQNALVALNPKVKLTHLFESSRVWQQRLSADNPILGNHKVFGQAVLPGLAWIDLLTQWFAEAGYSYETQVLKNVSIYRPLIVSETSHIDLLIEANEDKNGNWSIQVSPVPGDSDGSDSPFITAEMETNALFSFDEQIDIDGILSASNDQRNLDEIYQQCQIQELLHTGLMKAQGDIYRFDDEMWIHVKLDSNELGETNQYSFHPTLIDGSGVGSVELFSSKGDAEERLYLPLFYEYFKATEQFGDECFTRVRYSSLEFKEELVSLSMEFYNLSGKKIGELSNFKLKLVRDTGFMNSSETESKNEVPAALDLDGLSFDSMDGALQSIIASKIGVETSSIVMTLGYYELGLDSVRLLDVVKSLEQLLDTKLSPTLLFEYTTVESLSEYLSKKYELPGSTKSAESTNAKSLSHKTDVKKHRSLIKSATTHAALSTPLFTKGGTPSTMDIAVIGMSGRYPEANNLNVFWENLKSGKDSITQIPESRWDISKLSGVTSPSGKPMSNWGGFIEDVDCFDPFFFRISPREAQFMDPQERHFLEVCWEALEDAGYTPDNIVEPEGESSRRPVGVFVGVMHKDYTLLQNEAVYEGEVMPISLNYAPIANRISYVGNFHGPSMAIDTVCSSSLTAVHLAMESIIRGESKVAFAGGVNLSLHPIKYQSYGMMDMHSSDGRCRSFGDGGDGYVSAEGIGSLLLKPLQQAKVDGDSIYAVLKGSTINHVGASSGLTVPSPVAQAELMIDCFNKVGIDPETIGYIEAHGTGTSLGDPIEIQGLNRAFERFTSEKQFCALGSVKSNIGHAESAAGISGLTKTILQLHHKTLVKSLHADTVNPYLDLAQSPFYIQSDTRPWDLLPDSKQTLRRAGVSSFGASGSNAHIILEEYCSGLPNENAVEVMRPEGVLLPLSAKKLDRLKEYAQRLYSHLQENPNVDLADLAYTLQTGRIELEERLVIFAKSIGEAVFKLSQWLEDESNSHELWYGRVSSRGGVANLFTGDEDFQEAISQWMAKRKYKKLAELWVQGCSLNWPDLYQDISMQRIHLPTYPFEKGHYWVARSQNKSEGKAKARTNQNKMLEVPASNLNSTTKTDQQAFKSQSGQGQAQSISVSPSVVSSVSQKQALLVQPMWVEKPVGHTNLLPNNTISSDDADHIVFFIGSDESQFESITTLLSNATCIALKSDETELGQQFNDYASLLLIQLQNLLQAKPKNSIKIQLLIIHEDAATTKLCSALRGVLLAAQVENPGWTTQLIESDHSSSLKELLSILLNNIALTTDQHIRYRHSINSNQSVREVCRWNEVNSDHVDKSMPWKAGGIYLITGGTGGLGMIFAREIIEKVGNATLILTGRSQVNDATSKCIDELTEKGAMAVYHPVDVTNRTDVKELVQRIEQDYGALNGVLHSAGVLRDGFIYNKTEQAFLEVLRPKVQGVVALDEATNDSELDFMLLFSSVAGVVSNMGQSDYATANAFLDEYAHYRNNLVSENVLNGFTLSINWPLWQSGGMQVDETNLKLMEQHTGLVSLETNLAMAGLYRAWSLKGSQFMILDGHKQKLEEFFGFNGKVSVEKGVALNELTAIDQQESVSLESNVGDDLGNDLKEMNKGAREKKIIEYLTNILSEILLVDSDLIDPEIDVFNEFGVDSIMMMDILKEIKNDLGTTLYPRELYERTNLSSLAQYISDELVAVSNNASSKRDDTTENKFDTGELISSDVEFDDEEGDLSPVAFILSSPRAGSTLLRSMMAGHSQLFSPPELHLLNYQNMQHRNEHLSESYLGEGLQRSFMELSHRAQSVDGIAKSVEEFAEESAQFIDQLTADNRSIKDVYSEILSRVGSKILVDKSPTYAMNIDVLKRAEKLFSKAKYIHLVRHPYSVVESFSRMRMDKLIGVDNGNSYEVAESIWLESNQNIDLFFEEFVPLDRRLFVRYEDLISEPEAELQRICQFLEIDFDVELLNPYSDGRMTDGVHSKSMSIGDPNFHAHKGIEKSLGQVWKTISLPSALNTDTCNIASSYCYDLPAELVQAQDHKRNDQLAQRHTTVIQNNYEIAISEWGDPKNPAIVCVHGFLEQGPIWTEVASKLALLGYWVIAPDLKSHGLSSHAENHDDIGPHAYVRDIESVIDYIDQDKVVLIGHSMGTVVSSLYAHARPEKVSALILIEMILPGEEPADVIVDDVINNLSKPKRAPKHSLLDDINAASERIKIAVPSLTDNRALLLAKRITKEVEGGVIWTWNPELRSQASSLSQDVGRTNYLEILSELKLPIVMINGASSDFRRESDASSITHILGNTNCFELDGGHHIHIDSPKDTVYVIKSFLSESNDDPDMVRDSSLSN